MNRSSGAELLVSRLHFRIAREAVRIFLQGCPLFFTLRFVKPRLVPYPNLVSGYGGKNAVLKFGGNRCAGCEQWKTA